MNNSAYQHILDPEQRYFNRELSWVEFNGRVLQMAESEETPLLERIKFLAIFCSNFDEFFMVRVAGMRRMKKEGITVCESPESSPLDQVLEIMQSRVHQLFKRMNDAFNTSIVPTLKANDIQIKSYSEINSDQQSFLTHYFEEDVFPVLTPLAVDPAHPFPFLTNLGLYMVVIFPELSKDKARHNIGFIRVPEVLPRLIRMPSSKEKTESYEFILLEDLIKANMKKLFLGSKVEDAYPVRVTRDLDYQLLENAVSDLLAAIKSATSNRQFQEAVRLEISSEAPESIVELLRTHLHLDEKEVYRLEGPINLSGYASLLKLPLPQLKELPFNPRLPARMSNHKSFFNIIRDHDLLVHHPFESFYTVTEFLSAAANDPNVLAIKQTLYRCAGDSPIIDALIHASEAGKQVSVVIELKARFDERNNIVWANRLARAGVNVVFGFVGLKTHAKMILVARREHGAIRRYVHLSTGNYNSQTAKIYTDVGFFTCNKAIGQDVSAMFNVLTGVNVFRNGLPLQEHLPELKSLIMAPTHLRRTLVECINREIKVAKANPKDARIIVKTNALIDKEIIEKLYEASTFGVSIDLIVRGICCLRPGIKGLSENIRVISVIDRFLEHSRIFYFNAAGKRTIYISSADWMPRNFDRRIEVMFPIKEESIKDRILSEIFPAYLTYMKNASILESDGEYKPFKSKQNEISAQEQLILVARQGGLKSIPYEKAIRHKSTESVKRPVVKSSKARGRKKDK